MHAMGYHILIKFWNNMRSDKDEHLPGKKMRVRAKDVPHMTTNWKNVFRVKRRALALSRFSETQIPRTSSCWIEQSCLPYLTKTTRQYIAHVQSKAWPVHNKCSRFIHSQLFSLQLTRIWFHWTYIQLHHLWETLRYPSPKPWKMLPKDLQNKSCTVFTRV